VMSAERAAASSRVRFDATGNRPLLPEFAGNACG
jgi:hypothetical protein